MSKVYLVEEGFDEDISIIGIFTSKEKAEEYKKEMGEVGICITEFELDEKLRYPNT